MPSSLRPAILVAILIAILTLAMAACQVQLPIGSQGSSINAGEITDPDPRDELKVGMEIVESGGGGTLAFVPVTINGQGPYAFALDTGASHSVLDERIATELGLSEVGHRSEVTGVVGAAEAAQAHVEDWRIHDVDLGTRPVVVLDLSGPRDASGIEGLLGSDVLSEFGAIIVDYEERTLILRPRDLDRQ